ncbi:metal-sensitive transcriptional regulator [Clostridium algidicarnis]|uniref:metal-sensitive transcriptional regulator n=1 Tax=Clostridium algidicarnis TaxID=37659 RepID=UPI0004954588|nr:metal-sensitive transcriptional regulator [Clostridium algidicarnis]MBU3208756.1 metal-sensitive transcriptional regulator [Clostridium algidicarnis]MBU3226733.1 metal-sensitive transcriptional regulator [Clostridium algidicarnis]MBU3250356.1 metal-sensitive transcriptional regulator [Clostridium algidicarnis]
MEDRSDDLKKDIYVRLRRIEGQVKGIQNMVEKEACCKDMLVQIAAVRAAINKVGGLMLENYAINCMDLEETKENNEKVENLVSTLLMFLK